MAVSLHANFDAGDVRKQILQRYERFKKAVLMRLQRVGEQFVADARSVNTYKDDTGNLRSSIGYVILYNGQQVDSNFGGKTSEGVEAAKRAVESKGGAVGYVLIVVAGMEYAAAVESKGFDVLTGSSQVAESSLQKQLQTLMKKAGDMK